MASQGSLRTVPAGWDIELEDDYPSHIKADVTSTSAFYAAYGDTLYALDSTQKTPIAQASFDADILGVEVTSDTVWVLSQKSVTPLAPKTLTPLASALEGLCGTGISLSQGEGWLWITDVGGCLTRLDPKGRTLDTKTIDLNNRPGAPATTNYRPHAPTFAKGVGYAVAKTTEVVAFDPQTMEEIARRNALETTPPAAMPQAVDAAQGGVVVAKDGEVVVLKEQCPCL